MNALFAPRPCPRLSPVGWRLLAAALSPTPAAAWTYTLLDGSELVDDCPICARPTIAFPMRGQFSLRLLEEGPLFTTFAVEKISFQAGDRYEVTGSGTLRIGGEVAVFQQLFLEAQIRKGTETNQARLTQDLEVTQRTWPMLDISVTQTNGTFVQIYSLRLAAAPVREIWFSTLNDFHSAFVSPPSNSISSSDLLSSSGRVVRRASELTGRLGVMPPVPPLGLDAVDVLAGGEVAFSLGQDVFSESLGPLQEGDLVSDQGRVLRRNQDLLSAFSLQPPVADAGLDAFHLLEAASKETNEAWFSIRRDVFSEKLGQTLHRGDVLSSRGGVIRSNRDLLARFSPTNPGVDYGLDALYVWPSGEIWFSTEDGFTSTTQESFGNGDLLSDRGYVVWRNLDLLSPFAPIEDVNNFGLDGLWLVTDVTAVPAEPPLVVSIRSPLDRPGVELEWKGPGRVFQVEAAVEVGGPYGPLGPIGLERAYLDADAPGEQARRFYRVHLW